ncbi:uncharacterized protein I206_103734 [Kwoniella pini CBS 10737]|uniref:rhamnogalacturonan endolyase n=1 Tax=Kwoniella pini CBS 10737 TaxID=1296096 RepID=A0A1B9I988_9TREE|nr:uncharacterized protein I206_01265 [Kwoniella pini CBS 10737]OCF51981.1 hypothetical protein I206_01265 [Kwoniella pini CBS 10737]
MSILITLLLLGLTNIVSAFLNVTETNGTLSLQNDRVLFIMNKTTSYITTVIFDGVNLLGTPVDATSAIGPYADAILTPKQDNYVPGATADYSIVQGVDSSGIAYGGMIMSQNQPEGIVGEVFQQYWFLRETETSLHAFSRIAYHNSSVPFLADLQDIRTLFRPHGYLFTHLSTNKDFYVPQPRPNPAIDASKDLGIATLVQDTTWYIGNRTDDPFVENVADYFTKYTMSDTYRHHTVHGLFADGTNTPDNSTIGAWTIYNTKDTFFGGPTYSDLVVDGLLYNYIQSNHHGDQTPNITDGFDRTWGPAVFHLNHGAIGGSLQALQEEAESFANNTYAHQFYDDIAQHVPGYVTTAQRGSWKAQIQLPEGANNTIAILSAPGYDYQDNVFNTSAYQYWCEVGSDGSVYIDRIKAGEYRLTVYADNIFGDFIQEGIVISASQETDSGQITWNAESAGTELWRLGVPDKSAGEYKHGNHPDPNHPLHPPEYRIYWGAYDYVNDFPNGVNFKIGESNEADDFNYIQWSVFGGSLTRPEVVANPTINNWTISFDLQEQDLTNVSNATLTIQMAGVSTAAGNTDVLSNKTKYSNLPFVVAINSNELEPWVIPYYRSSSCAIRSAVTCYQNAHKFTFPTSYLQANATNEMVLSLPYNASGISVMYDAIRLEVQ